MHADARGSFTEFLRTPDRGQVSVNVLRPGIVKGNHWHHTKNEKFLVVKGSGVVRFRPLLGGDVTEYPVNGEVLTAVEAAGELGAARARYGNLAAMVEGVSPTADQSESVTGDATDRLTDRSCGGYA